MGAEQRLEHIFGHRNVAGTAVEDEGDCNCIVDADWHHEDAVFAHERDRLGSG
jgi:hypothetical protein